MRELFWTDLSPLWERSTEFARAIDKTKAGYETQRIWRKDQNLIGVLGEQTFAQLTGKVINSSVLLGGDGGRDFEGEINVKATEYIPALIQRDKCHLIENDPPKHWAAYYVLTVIDITKRLGAVFGWATRQTLQSAPIINFGYGQRRAILARDLREWRPKSARAA